MYKSFATREASPPSSLRGRDRDYSELSLEDQAVVDCLLGGAQVDTPSRHVITFIRRYHKEWE